MSSMFVSDMICLSFFSLNSLKESWSKIELAELLLFYFSFCYAVSDDPFLLSVDYSKYSFSISC